MYGIRASWPISSRDSDLEGTVWETDRDWGPYGWSHDLQAIVTIVSRVGPSASLSQMSQNPLLISYDLGETFEDFRPFVPASQENRYHTGVYVERSRWVAYTVNQTFPRRGPSYSDDLGLTWNHYSGASDEIQSVSDLGNGYFTAKMNFEHPDSGRSIGWWRVPYDATTWTQLSTATAGSNGRDVLVDGKMLAIDVVGVNRYISRNYAASWEPYSTAANPLVMTVVNGVAFAFNGNGDIIRTIDGEPDSWEVVHEGKDLPFYDPAYPEMLVQYPVAWPANNRYMFAYILMARSGTGSYQKLVAINPYDLTDFHDFSHPELMQANRVDVAYVTPPNPVTNVSALLISNNNLSGFPDRRRRFRWLFENVATP